MPLPLSRNSFTASRLNSLLNRRRGFRRFVTGHLILAGHCLKEVSTKDGQAQAAYAYAYAYAYEVNTGDPWV